MQLNEVTWTDTEEKGLETAIQIRVAYGFVQKTCVRMSTKLSRSAELASKMECWAESDCLLVLNKSEIIIKRAINNEFLLTECLNVQV